MVFERRAVIKKRILIAYSRYKCLLTSLFNCFLERFKLMILVLSIDKDNKSDNSVYAIKVKHITLLSKI